MINDRSNMTNSWFATFQGLQFFLFIGVDSKKATKTKLLKKLRHNGHMKGWSSWKICTHFIYNCIYILFLKFWSLYPSYIISLFNSVSPCCSSKESHWRKEKRSAAYKNCYLYCSNIHITWLRYQVLYWNVCTKFSPLYPQFSIPLVW